MSEGVATGGIVRQATVRDVPVIAGLVNQFAQRGLMLFRSHAELYETLRDFVVYDAAGAGVVGVCALEIVWANLGEVKSLAVEAGRHGQGIGRQLVEAAVAEARRLEVQQVFALTYQKAFFEKLGFSVVDRHALPLKVWSDCVKCPKRTECDEIAMVRTLFAAPVVQEPSPDASFRYDVPTQIVQLRGK